MKLFYVKHVITVLFCDTVAEYADTESRIEVDIWIKD